MNKIYGLEASSFILQLIYSRTDANDCRNLNISKRAQNMHYRVDQKIALRKR